MTLFNGVAVPLEQVPSLSLADLRGLIIEAPKYFWSEPRMLFMFNRIFCTKFFCGRMPS